MWGPQTTLPTFSSVLLLWTHNYIASSPFSIPMPQQFVSWRECVPLAGKKKVLAWSILFLQAALKRPHKLWEEREHKFLQARGVMLLPLPTWAPSQCLTLLPPLSYIPLQPSFMLLHIPTPHLAPLRRQPTTRCRSPSLVCPNPTPHFGSDYEPLFGSWTGKRP